jgi:CPA2 family monovalent cation:H+ antiporter-2
VAIDIEPFKGLLLGLFFISVGMGIDLRWIVDQAFWIGTSVLGLLAIKATVTTGLCLVFGVPRPTAFEAGLLLGQGGEFAFVVVGMAMTLGLVPLDVGQFMLIVTSLSMLATPFIALIGRRIAGILAGAETRTVHETQATAEPLEGHVLIAGFGRIGQTLGRVLDEEHVPYIAVDLDSETVTRHRRSGRPVHYGDAARLEMLRRARADTAQAAVVTMDSSKHAEQAVRTIRREWPMLPVFARARDAYHAERLLRLGATSVVHETMESSLQLSAHILEVLGWPQEAIDQRLNLARQADPIAAMTELDDPTPTKERPRVSR